MRAPDQYWCRCSNATLRKGWHPIILNLQENKLTQVHKAPRGVLVSSIHVETKLKSDLAATNRSFPQVSTHDLLQKPDSSTQGHNTVVMPSFVFLLVLVQSVRAHMVFIMGARSAWNEDHVLSRLPPNIRESVLEHVHRDAIELIPILKTRPPGFVSAILRSLRPQQYTQVRVDARYTRYIGTPCWYQRSI